MHSLRKTELSYEPKCLSVCQSLPVCSKQNCPNYLNVQILGKSSLPSLPLHSLPLPSPTVASPPLPTPPLDVERPCLLGTTLNRPSLLYFKAYKLFALV